MDDLISRQAAIEKFEPWLKVNGYSEGELNMLKAVLYELRFLPSVQPEILACGEGELNVPDTNVGDCSDCIKHGGDWDCDHVHCHKGKSAQPDNDMIHLQKEQAYLQGWEEGRKALKEEIWEDGRDRLD